MDSSAMVRSDSDRLVIGNGLMRPGSSSGMVRHGTNRHKGMGGNGAT